MASNVQAIPHQQSYGLEGRRAEPGLEHVQEARLVLEGYDEAETWAALPMKQLMSQLEIKAKRLAAADPENLTELFHKAAIIGGLVMMITDKASRVRQEHLGLPDAPTGDCVEGPASSVAHSHCAAVPHGTKLPQVNSTVQTFTPLPE